MTSFKIPSGKALFVLAVAFLLLLFNGGSRFTIGLTLKPMADDLVWSRTTLSLTVTVFMVVSAVVLPVIGRLVDRYNPKVILALALLVSSTSIALMGLIQTPFQAILLYGVIFALSNAGTSVAPIGVLISRWFPDRLGLANSIAISGMGVGQLVIILLLTAQLDVIGWRGAFILLAGLGLVLIVPLMFLGVPTTAHQQTNQSTSGVVDDSRGGVSTAVCTPVFWILIVIYAICGGQDFFVATHVVAFASDQGLTSTMAGQSFCADGTFRVVWCARNRVSDRSLWSRAANTGLFRSAHRRVYSGNAAANADDYHFVRIVLWHHFLDYSTTDSCICPTILWSGGLGLIQWHHYHDPSGSRGCRGVLGWCCLRCFW